MPGSVAVVSDSKRHFFVQNLQYQNRYTMKCQTVLIVLGLSILKTMAFKTKIALIVPEVCETKLVFDVELKEDKIYGNVVGIPHKDLVGSSQKTTVDLMKLMKLRIQDIILSVEYNGTWIETRPMSVTPAETKAGNITYGFGFEFLKLPYQTASVESGSWKSIPGYFKENTSELIFHVKKDEGSLLTEIESNLSNDQKFYLCRTLESEKEPIKATIGPKGMNENDVFYFLIIRVHRNVELFNPEYVGSGVFDVNKNEIVLKTAQDIEQVWNMLDTVELLAFAYTYFPAKFCPGFFLSKLGYATERDDVLGPYDLPLSIRRADTIESDYTMYYEGKLDSSGLKITFIADSSTKMNLIEELDNPRLSWHVTVGGIQTKWVINPKFKDAAEMGDELYKVTVAFENVV